MFNNYPHPTSPKFHSVLLYDRSFFQIIEVFGFSIGYNGEFEIFKKKSLKIGNSKFKKSQTYFCEDHWEENSGKVESFQLRFVGGVAF